MTESDNQQQQQNQHNHQQGQPMDETRTMPQSGEKEQGETDQVTNKSAEIVTLETPEKAPRIPKDDSFKTCKTEMPNGVARRQLRMTPARNSILSGQQPFKEVSSSSKKFNRRRKANKSQNGSKLNETANSHETFVAHEQELLFDRDSLDTHPPSARRMRISSTPKPCFERVQPSVTRPKPPAPVDSEIKKPQMPPKPRVVESKIKAPRPRPNPVPSSKFKEPRPQPKAFNRFVTPRNNNFSTRYCESARSSIFKRPSMAPAGPLTRTQSFKSTAELERDYFNSLRSRI